MVFMFVVARVGEDIIAPIPCVSVIAVWIAAASGGCELQPANIMDINIRIVILFI
jgi:hypothetical protein